MKTISAFSLAAAAALLAGPVFAADLYVPRRSPAPAPAPVMSGYDWTGFYLGVNAGYGSGLYDWDLTSTTNYSGDFDVSGWTLGGQLGANAQFDMFVLGLEGDIAWSGISGEGSAIGGQVPSFSVDWLGTIRGRAGVAFDSALLYATAGWAYGGATASLSNFPSPSVTTTRDTSVSGYVVGVGAELALTDAVSVKGEYLYHGLTMAEVDYTPPASQVNATLGLHTIKAGLNFHF
jgi:outer membrane immunogenic protein